MKLLHGEAFTIHCEDYTEFVNLSIESHFRTTYIIVFVVFVIPICLSNVNDELIRHCKTRLYAFAP